MKRSLFASLLLIAACGLCRAESVDCSNAAGNIKYSFSRPDALPPGTRSELPGARGRHSGGQWTIDHNVFFDDELNIVAGDKQLLPSTPASGWRGSVQEYTYSVSITRKDGLPLHGSTKPLVDQMRCKSARVFGAP